MYGAINSRSLFKALQVAAMAGLLVSMAGATSMAQTERPLWRQKPTTKTLRKDHEASNAIAVQIDVGMLRSEGNAGFSLPLPGGRTVAIIESRERRTDRGLVWHGQVVDDPASLVSLSVVNDTVVGSILMGDGQSFRLRRDPSGEQVIEEIDLGKLPQEEDATPKPQRRGDNAANRRRIACSTDSADRIDVLVFYTADARIGAGGADAMKAMLDIAEDQTNMAYENSGIQQRIKIVDKLEVDYRESGNVTKDRDRLQAKGDHYLDGVHALRDRYGADIVALIVENIDKCGKSFVMEHPADASFEDHAFAVIKRSCAAAHGKYSFPHELGHVMGARHDRYTDATENSPFPDNHGYIRTTPTTGSPWRTIMAYSTNASASCAETNPCAMAAAAAHTSPDKFCPRVLNFSNPLVSVRGDPTGTDREDNHQALNKTAATVAAFRCSVSVQSSNR